MRLYARRQYVESLHVAVVAVQVHLHYLHRLELFEACLLGDLVLARVRVMLEVSYVGDVAHISDLVPQVFQVTEQDVESHGRAGVTQVGVAVYGRAADIHAYMSGVNGLERLLGASQRIVDGQIVFHGR